MLVWRAAAGASGRGGGRKLWFVCFHEGCFALFRPAGPVATVLTKIFSWWNGATLGTLFTIAKRGVFIGTDDFGNRYYEAKDARDSYNSHRRRWVTYNGMPRPPRCRRSGTAGGAAPAAGRPPGRRGRAGPGGGAI